MDNESQAILLRAGQMIALIVGAVALIVALNAYDRLHALAASGKPIEPTVLAIQPSSLIPHLVVFFACILAIELAERRYRRLRPNNRSPSAHGRPVAGQLASLPSTTRNDHAD